jgi:peptidoglycan hydrolase-like protein with peptidoglycan-binding domain
MLRFMAVSFTVLGIFAHGSALARSQPRTIHRPDQTVRQVQVELKRLGYYAGKVDGIAGSQTQVALVAYRERVPRRRRSLGGIILVGCGKNGCFPQ